MKAIDLSRRSVLKAGAVAAGAILTPGAAAGAPAPHFATSKAIIRAGLPWYRDLVEGWAELARPDFLAGRLHAFNEEDQRLDEELEDYETSLDLLEASIRSSLAEEDFATAYLVLACSPNEANADGGRTLEHVRWTAAECIAKDVLFLARERGWYKPTPGEAYQGETWGAEPERLYGPITTVEGA